MPLGIVHLQLGLQLGAGAPEFAAPPPPPSTARNFNGTSSDYLEAADSASLRTPSAAITVACWVRPTSATPPASATALRKHIVSPVGYTFLLAQNTTLSNRFWFIIKVSSTNKSTDTAPALIKGTWYFLVGRWASGGKVNLDIYNADGSLYAHVESVSTASGTLTYAADPLYVGNKADLTQGLNADLAQIYIDNTSLSDADVQTLLSGTRPHTASAGSWLVGVASPDPDDSGNGNNLTVHGTTLVAGP